MSPEYQKTITIKPSIANTVMISGTDENGFGIITGYAMRVEHWLKPI